MKTPHSIHRALFLVLLFTFVASGIAQNTAAQPHWVATWAASAQQPPAVGGQRGPAQAAPTAAAPAAPAPAAPAPQRGGAPQITSLNNQTIRMFVRTSVGGTGLRVEFSNAYG